MAGSIWPAVLLLGTTHIISGHALGFAASVEEARSRLSDLQVHLQDSVTAGEYRSANNIGIGDDSRIRPWNKNDLNSAVNTSVMKLKTPQDKMSAIRRKLLQKIVQESRQVSSNNQSIITIAMLAFGVLLFDLIGDAMFGTSNNMFGSFGGENIISARETMLPGFGVFGDNVNNMAEIALNMLTIYMYRDESPDCGERLLCESNQQAVSRGLFDSFVTYLSGFAISFFLNEAPVSQNLEAMRAGRHGKHCGEIYPRCAISL